MLMMFLFVVSPSVPGERAAEDVPALGVYGNDGSGQWQTPDAASELRNPE